MINCAVLSLWIDGNNIYGSAFYHRKYLRCRSAVGTVVAASLWLLLWPTFNVCCRGWRRGLTGFYIVSSVGHFVPDPAPLPSSAFLSAVNPWEPNNVPRIYSKNTIEATILISIIHFFLNILWRYLFLVKHLFINVILYWGLCNSCYLYYQL